MFLKENPDKKKRFWNNNYVEYKSITLTFLSKLLTKEMQESYENVKICGICKEKL